MIKLEKFRWQWSKALFQQLSNNLVQQYLDIPVNTYANFEGWIKNIEWLEWTNQAHFWIAFNEENKMIGGTIVHRLLEEDSIMEMGTWIDKQYWGKGYNLVLKNEVLRYLFEIYEIERVILFVQKENQRAIFSLKKIPYIKNKKEEEDLNIQKYWKWKEYKLGIPLHLYTITKQDFLNRS